MGERAERLVEERLRAALPEEARLYANVRFTAKTREHGPAHDGEADIVIVHPDYGLLVIETKSGAPSLAHGTWYLGDRKLDRSPFAQAEDAKHDLKRTIEALPNWPSGRELRAGHAVAFPDVDLASLPKGHALLGPDAKLDLVFDADAFATPEATRRALARVRDWWVADGSRAYPLTPAEFAVVIDFLAPTVELRRLLRHDLEEGRSQLLMASRAQQLVLNQNRSRVRAEVVGPAGSGKSLIAVEMACRLAREGFRTLYVCFNQPLATAVLREVEEREAEPDRRPDVLTFHRLCEILGQRAGVLPPRPPKPIPQAWWDETLPTALKEAIDADDGSRYHAIVVDEGQDFRLDWLETLPWLLFEPEDGVFWVFHDPGQALRRDDEVAGLKLGPPLELFEDYRSPAPVSALAARFYRGSTEPVALGRASVCPTSGRPCPVRRPSMPCARRCTGCSSTRACGRGRSSCCRASRRRRAGSGDNGGSGMSSCGTARSTTQASRSACRQMRCPTSRRTTRSCCSRPSAGSKASSDRSWCCASCPRRPIGWTSCCTPRSRGRRRSSS